MRNIRWLLALVLLVAAASPAQAGGLSEKKLAKYGVRTIKCPRFIAHAKSGLTTSILRQTTWCLSGAIPSKARKEVTMGHLVINGSAKMGHVFSPVESMQGDVQTLPFEVIHYPAIFTVELEDASLRTKVQFTIIDADTGKNRRTFWRVYGDENSEAYFNWHVPGRYYLKIQGFPDPKEEVQPVFNVSMEYLEEYEGFRVSARDMKWAKVKRRPCPAYLIDKQTSRAYKVGRKFICSNARPGQMDDAGFTIAPLNLGVEMFMATEDWSDGIGDMIGMPFRISKSTLFYYGVYDPTEGRMSVTMNLMHFATRTVADRFVSVRGSIDGAESWINIPGDYYVDVNGPTNMTKDEEFLEWEYEVEGSY